MSIVQKIQKDLVTGLKQKEAATVAVLRLLKNSLKNLAIDKHLPESELADQDTVTVLRQEVKKRRDSIEAFTRGGRQELADQEKDEIAVIEKYLPMSLAPAAIDELIRQVIADDKMTPPFNFGRLMGSAVKKAAGQADGQEIKSRVEKFLSEQG